MEEIILKAKAGPPVSRLVGNHVEVTKGLVDATIVEKHTKRRITGKQSLNAAMVRRELIATVKAASKKTKRQGKHLVKEAVDGLMTLANKQGVDLKANFVRQLHTIASELAETNYGPANKEEQIARLKQVVDILRANGAIA